MRHGIVLSTAKTGPFAFERLYRYWETYDPGSDAKAALLAERYLLASEGRHHAYFVPIGAVPDANNRIVVVGLTPGFTQVQRAARLYATTDAATREDDKAFSGLLKSDVAFGGSMRTNLCTMFDELGLHTIFGVPASNDFFAPDSSLIATTSALVYPVFQGPSLINFPGAFDLAKSILFREMIEALLAPRLIEAPHALIVPLGKSAGTAIRHLVAQHRLDERRVLWDFPHPSGANGHRRQLFRENKDELAKQLREWFRAA